MRPGERWLDNRPRLPLTRRGDKPDRETVIRLSESVSTCILFVQAQSEPSMARFEQQLEGYTGVH
jgi:hypothetical protein